MHFKSEVIRFIIKEIFSYNNYLKFYTYNIHTVNIKSHTGKLKEDVIVHLPYLSRDKPLLVLLSS